MLVAFTSQRRKCWFPVLERRPAVIKARTLERRLTLQLGSRYLKPGESVSEETLQNNLYCFSPRTTRHKIANDVDDTSDTHKYLNVMTGF